MNSTVKKMANWADWFMLIWMKAPQKPEDEEDKTEQIVTYN